jgi:CDP-Glycerol:Poly(glycerophosphate) glycerophosphotransferase
MSEPGSALRALDAVRRLDTRLSRYRDPYTRDILLDARTAMEYAMMSPVHQALAVDPRVRVWLTSSERPHRAWAIYGQAAAPAQIISPRRAMTMRFDACLAADLVWASLPRGCRRVQMFHGVAGKWGHIYDRPATSMREWHRLFFINQRRLRNFVAAGALDAGSEAIRLVGMPRSDCLVDGSLQRDAVLESRGLDPSHPTVLYAPTWTPYSSLNAVGEAVVSGLVDAGYTVLVKLHENSFDLAYANSGGIDWAARLAPILQRGTARLVREPNASPWLVAADVLITDHSSVGFEYLLLDRPLVRIEVPELIERARVPHEYVDLIASASTAVHDAGGVLREVDRAFADPSHGSETRREVAAETFYRPGGATRRAVHELYELMELTAPRPADSGDDLDDHPVVVPSRLEAT